MKAYNRFFDTSILRINTIQLAYLVKVLVLNPKYFFIKDHSCFNPIYFTGFPRYLQCPLLRTWAKNYVWKGECDLVPCLVTGISLLCWEIHRGIDLSTVLDFANSLSTFMCILNVWPESLVTRGRVWQEVVEIKI